MCVCACVCEFATHGALAVYTSVVFILSLLATVSVYVFHIQSAEVRCGCERVGLARSLPRSLARICRLSEVPGYTAISRGFLLRKRLQSQCTL